MESLVFELENPNHSSSLEFSLGHQYVYATDLNAKSLLLHEMEGYKYPTPKTNHLKFTRQNNSTRNVQWLFELSTSQIWFLNNDYIGTNHYYMTL